MKKIVLLAFVLVLFSMSVLGTQLVVTGDPTTHHIYPGQSIQEAINLAQSGDTIFVHNGTYYENVVVNKTVSLVGENRSATIVDGKGTGNVVTITQENVNITGFTIRNSGASYPDTGIYLDNANHCNITNNNITANNNWCGVWLNYSSYSTVSGNNITNNAYGVYIDYSSYSTVSGNNITANTANGVLIDYSSYSMVSGNNITNNGDGVYIYYSSGNTVSGNNITNNWCGVWLDHSSGNTVSGNNITNNGDGVRLDYSFYNTISGNNITAKDIKATYPFGINLADSSNNTISRNNIANNWYGVNFWQSSSNTFYHNNFIDNTQQVYSDSYANIWDDGYPSGGNYWSNYTGVDANGDGIGDTPHDIDGNNQDRYPLTGLFNALDAGTWDSVAYSVDVVSNSTVSDFYFNPDVGPVLYFNVTGSDGTTGFSRVAIPKELLWVENGWVVLVGGEPVVPTVTQDVDYTYLYFTYSHSTKTVEIQGTSAIPEFTTWALILLALIVLAAAITITKRRLLKTPTQ